MATSSAKVLKREPLDPSEAKWTKLIKITYQDPSGKQRLWESAERPTRPASSTVDAVGIVAILQKSTGPEILLEKQFRPAVGKVCIEVPAGLVDEGEGARQSAVRELREETGYVGTVVEEEGGEGKAEGGMVMFNDPGFTNTNTTMIHMSVDMELPENKNPKPQLEPGEFIECITIPLKDLYRECRRLEEQGYAIDARVGTMAEGIEISRRWKLA